MRLFLFRGALDALLGDEGLQDARVGVLRIAEVEYLVEQFVDEHKVANGQTADGCHTLEFKSPFFFWICAMIRRHNLPEIDF